MKNYFKLLFSFTCLCLSFFILPVINSVFVFAIISIPFLIYYFKKRKLLRLDDLLVVLINLVFAIIFYFVITSVSYDDKTIVYPIFQCLFGLTFIYSLIMYLKSFDSLKITKETNKKVLISSAIISGIYLLITGFYLLLSNSSDLIIILIASYLILSIVFYILAIKNMKKENFPLVCLYMILNVVIGVSFLIIFNKGILAIGMPGNDVYNYLYPFFIEVIPFSSDYSKKFIIDYPFIVSLLITFTSFVSYKLNKNQ